MGLHPSLRPSVSHPFGNLVGPDVLEQNQARGGDPYACRRSADCDAYHRFCRHVRATGNIQRAVFECVCTGGLLLVTGKVACTEVVWCYYEVNRNVTVRKGHGGSFTNKDSYPFGRRANEGAIC